MLAARGGPVVDGTLQLQFFWPRSYEEAVLGSGGGSPRRQSQAPLRGLSRAVQSYADVALLRFFFCFCFLCDLCGCGDFLCLLRSTRKCTYAPCSLFSVLQFVTVANPCSDDMHLAHAAAVSRYLTCFADSPRSTAVRVSPRPSYKPRSKTCSYLTIDLDTAGVTRC